MQLIRIKGGILTQTLVDFQGHELTCCYPASLAFLLHGPPLWCFRICLLVNVYSLLPGTPSQGCGIGFLLPEHLLLGLSQPHCLPEGHSLKAHNRAEQRTSPRSATWRILFFLLHGWQFFGAKMTQTLPNLQTIPEDLEETPNHSGGVTGRHE